MRSLQIGGVEPRGSDEHRVRGPHGLWGRRRRQVVGVRHGGGLAEIGRFILILSNKRF